MSEVGIYTAQNVHIDFKLAGLGDRVAAFILDAFVMMGYSLLMSAILPSLLGIQAPGWFTTIFYLPVMLYHPIFEIMLNGQSPGKRQMKIKVLMADGSAPGIGSFLLRWIISPIDFFLSGGIAIVSIILTRKSQRLGDLVAGTVVAKDKLLDDYDRNFLRRKTNNDYQPSFPNVKYRISQKEMELMRTALKVKVENVNNRPAEKIRSLIENKLEVKSDLATVAFLHTVIKDFEFYNSQEE